MSATEHVTDPVLTRSVSVAVWGEGFLAEATTRACEGRGHLLTEPSLCEVLWFAAACPVGTSDVPDVEAVLAELAAAIECTNPGSLILVSTPVPVGTTARMEEAWPERRFAVQPENVRRATALYDILHQSRVVVGTRRREDEPLLRALLSPFTPAVFFMSPESAEMTKHALNAFLALNIAFANEVADLCDAAGADVQDVNMGFRSDRRVGNGPLRPGRGFTGGTLGRDVTVLAEMGAGPVISSIRASNEGHV